MHDHPFVQGLSECAEIGKAMAKAAGKPASGCEGSYLTWSFNRASLPCGVGLLEENFRVFRQRHERFCVLVRARILPLSMSYTQPCRRMALLRRPTATDGWVLMLLSCAKTFSCTIAFTLSIGLSRFSSPPPLLPHQNSAASGKRPASAPDRRCQQSPSSRRSWSGRK